MPLYLSNITLVSKLNFLTVIVIQKPGSYINISFNHTRWLNWLENKGLWTWALQALAREGTVPESGHQNRLQQSPASTYFHFQNYTTWDRVHEWSRTKTSQKRKHLVISPDSQPTVSPQHRYSLLAFMKLGCHLPALPWLQSQNAHNHSHHPEGSLGSAIFPIICSSYTLQLFAFPASI